MGLVSSVLETAEKTVASNTKDLRQQGIEKFIRDNKIDTNSVSQEDIEAAYEAFKKEHPDKLENGEYVGNKAKSQGDSLSCGTGKINSTGISSTIDINGTKVDIQKLVADPQATLRKAAETMVKKELDKVIRDNVNKLLKQTGSTEKIKTQNGTSNNIRDIIRGVNYAIFQDPSMKTSITNSAQKSINDYYKSILEMMESPDWEKDPLKPLQDIINESERPEKEKTNQTKKLDNAAKTNIAKYINDQIIGRGGQLDEITKKLEKFGLGKSTLEAIGINLDGQISGCLGQNAQKNIEQISDINKRVAEVKDYMKRYEHYAADEIKLFEEKARDYVKQLEVEFINNLLQYVNLNILGELASLFNINLPKI